MKANKTKIDVFHHTVDALDEQILVIDINKNVLLINTALKQKLISAGNKHAENYLKSQVKCTQLFDGTDYSCKIDHNQCPFAEIFGNHKPKKTIQHHNESSQYIELSMTPLFDSDNEVYGFVESRRDVSNHINLNEKLKKSKSELYDLAHVDSLTCIPNRRSFLTQLEKSISIAQKKRTQIALLFVDLDNFKQINDTLGHQLGDEVLKVSAKRLQGMVRENDIVYRLGGDEFVVLVESIKKPENAGVLAQKIISNQSQKIKINQHELFVKSSIGISIYPENGITAESLLQHADIAMYESKQQGRNTFCFYKQELTDHAFKRLLLEKDLNQAIDKN